MTIHQFEDKNLAHYSYAILSLGEIVLIDPARNPEPYYAFAKEHQAKIKAVIETHPHADFVSSHLEIAQTTGAEIYVSKLVKAEYPHTSFDDGNSLEIGAVVLNAINTPGHSPDSISILLSDENGKQHAVFTGDTLFIGDCGRPDLREEAGAITASRKELAKAMYHSLQTKLKLLDDQVLVYPAHGAGSLCGKALSSANVSTIRDEKISNWSLQNISEDQFVKELLSDQPFIPKYFPYDVAVNKKGASPFSESISKIKSGTILQAAGGSQQLDSSIAIIDTRPQHEFKKSHIKRAINLMNDTKFETWLGSIIAPDERFYLIAENEATIAHLKERIAKIGYERQVEEILLFESGDHASDFFDVLLFKNNPHDYTIVDIRNESEVKTGKFFEKAIHIPLHELRERAEELPIDKPIVVHCAGGYRSAAGSSIIQSILQQNATVHDLSEAVKQFQS